MEETATKALAAIAESGAAEIDAADGALEIAVGYGGSLTSDVALFAESLEQAGMAVSPVAEVIMEPLGAIDREAVALGEFAAEAAASGNEMTPSEIVELTMRSQEFMFHSQLTANVANRTADGVQQLFRQQG